MELSEQDFLDLCKTKIEEKYHLGNGVHHLKQRDFEYLIDVIEETSGIKLSVSTLKRLWREKNEQNPHPTTLDALVSILDCKDWLDFKVQHAPDSGTIPPQTTEAETKQDTLKPVLVVTALIGIFCLTLLIIFNFRPLNPVDTPDTSALLFNADITVQTGVPNTVIFNYDLSGIQADTFFIQQDWNPMNKHEIDPSANFFTTTYYFPGFHRARLIADETVLKMEDVFIRTDGWLAAALHRDDEEHPIYLDADSARGGMLSIREEVLLENGVDPNRFEGVGFFNIGDFGGLDAHNFKSETRFRFREFVNVSCPFMQFTIHTEANIYFVQLTSMGCVGELELMIGDRYLTGNNSDLSAFGADISEWQELAITVENKNATIYLNGEQLIQLAFNGDFGTIVGVDYRFVGIGDLDYLRFKKPDNTLVYEDNF